jgi:hypothetical protein
VAYGLLHLLPAQFYALTPLELDRMAECRAKAEQRKEMGDCLLGGLPDERPYPETGTDGKADETLPAQENSSEMAAERDAFFEEFRRKGADGSWQPSLTFW